MCLARLSSDDSTFTITKNHSVSYLKLCEREAVKGRYICSECDELQRKPTRTAEFSLTLADGCLVYRKIGGKEFEAKYNKGQGVLVLTTNQPIPWSPSLSKVFQTPTQFAKETARAVQGLDKKISVNGWVTCYTKDEKGKTLLLNESRGTGPGPGSGSGSGSVECVKGILYGLLSEPFTNGCNIYGSPLFWKSLEHGDLPDSWIEEAEEVEEEAKLRCKRAGLKFYELEVQSNTAEVEEMVKKPLPKPETISTSNKIIQYTKKIDKVYQETADEPEKLATDTQKIWKETFENKEVWRCETGFVFLNENEKPGKLLGRYVDDMFNRF